MGHTSSWSSGEPTQEHWWYLVGGSALSSEEKPAGKIKHIAIPPKCGPKQSGIFQGHGFSLLFFTPNRFPSPRVRHLSSEWTQESRDHRHWGPRPWKSDHAQPGNFRTSATVPLSALNHRTPAVGPKMVMFIFLLLSQATAWSLEKFHFYVQSIWPLRAAQAEGQRAALPCFLAWCNHWLLAWGWFLWGPQVILGLHTEMSKRGITNTRETSPK